MRELYFALCAPIGPWTTPTRGSLLDLTNLIPYFVTLEIPPLRVVNDMFARGQNHAGMSGGALWEPFEIDEAEFEELVTALKQEGIRSANPRHAGKRLEVFDPGTEVQRWETWSGLTRAERKRGSSELQPTVAALELEADRDALYERWLEQLPVAALYLGCLRAYDPDWVKQPNPRLPLATDLLDELRRVEDLENKWAYGRKGLAEDELMQITIELVDRVDLHRARVAGLADELGLPRWPFYSKPLAEAVPAYAALVAQSSSS